VDLPTYRHLKCSVTGEHFGYHTLSMYLNEEMPKRMKQNRKRTGRIKDRKLKYFGHIIIAA